MIEIFALIEEIVDYLINLSETIPLNDKELYDYAYEYVDKHCVDMVEQTKRCIANSSLEAYHKWETE